jgi:hypothetical protein
MNLTDYAEWATIGGTFAVAVTVAVLLIELHSATKADRQTVAISLLKMTSQKSFAVRRFKLHDSLRNPKALDWDTFDDSKEDFECRAVAFFYELIGQLVDKKILDYELVRDFLQFSVVADWRAFGPLHLHLLKRFHSKESEWRHFGWLASRIARDLADHEYPPVLLSKPATTDNLTAHFED